jgi:hypothetical protein
VFRPLPCRRTWHRDRALLLSGSGESLLSLSSLSNEESSLSLRRRRGGSVDEESESEVLLLSELPSDGEGLGFDLVLAFDDRRLRRVDRRPPGSLISGEKLLSSLVLGAYLLSRSRLLWRMGFFEAPVYVARADTDSFFQRSALALLWKHLPQLATFVAIMFKRVKIWSDETFVFCHGQTKPSLLRLRGIFLPTSAGS